jgi:prevent-host-death family protein
MTEVDVHDAKRQLSRIIEMVANGEEIIITNRESLSRG